MRQRRIGTITLGISLVVFGILFLIHIFGGVLNYMLIFHLWPLILIVLGGEILYYSFFAPEKSGTDRKSTRLNSSHPSSSRMPSSA